MTGRLQKQVNPKVAAALLLLVLVAVQYVWWRGLVYRGPAGPPGGGGGGGGPGPSYQTIRGYENVLVETLSGDLEPGSEDGPGYAARFDRPTGLAIDGAEVIYVADTGNHRIRKVLPNGETSTLAGSEQGYADGPALQARFNAPCGVAVASNGIVYVADTGNNCIRKIENGQVSTVIGTPPTPDSRSTLDLPTSVACAYGKEATFLYVAEAGKKRVSQYFATGALIKQLPMGGAPTSVSTPMLAIAIPQSGTLLLGEKVLKNTPFTDASPEANPPNPLTLRNPVAIAQVGTDWLVTDGNHAALFLVRDGSALVMAGNCSSGGPMRGSQDGTGENAQFGVLCGVVADSKGHAYVADTANNNIRRVTLFSPDAR